MSTDEQFARALREHAAALAPQVTVRTEGVVPAARRRRVAQVGALTLATGLVLSGGAYAGTVWAAGPEVLPAGPATPSVSTPAPSPSSAEDFPLEGWPDAAYWHVAYSLEEQSPGVIYGVPDIEAWIGHNPPSVQVRSDAESAGYSPSMTFATLLLDGVETELDWEDVYALPTDPVALDEMLRAGVIPDDPNRGSADDQVRDNVRRLLLWSPASPALRGALWEVLVGQPGVTVEQGVTDTASRPGVAASFDLVDGTAAWTIVYDPESRLGLEQVERSGDTAVTITLRDQGPADVVPAGADAVEEPERVIIPHYLVGLQLAVAELRLDELGLAVNPVWVDAPGSPHGTVMSVGSAGTEVPSTAVVDLYVSDGEPLPDVVIPDVVGMTLEEAGEALSAAHLNAMVVPVPSDQPAGTVLSQDPGAGATVDGGDHVRIDVSTGSNG